MGLYVLRGRLSQLGQSDFDNDRTIYAYIEFIDSKGARTLVKKVAVFTDVDSGLQAGMEGEFYLDDIMIPGRRAHCQLWGFATSERRVIDDMNLRVMVMRSNLVCGILFTPVFGAGLLRLIMGLSQLSSILGGAARRREFLRRLDAGLEIAPRFDVAEAYRSRVFLPADDTRAR